MKKIDFTILVLLILFSGLVLSYQISKPFYGIHDYNGVDYGNHARNHVKYGYLATKFGMATDAGIFDKDAFSPSYYTHHPALLTVLISFSYRLLGINEFSTRMVPILFSMCMIGGLYLVSSYILGRIYGIIVVLSAISTPMFIYYAKLPAHEPLLLCMGIWLIYAYIQWIDSHWSYYPLLGITLLIGLTGWPGYFFIPAVSFHALLFNRVKFKQTLYLWLISIRV